MRANDKLGFFLCFLLLLVIQLLTWKDMATIEDPVEFNVSVKDGMVLEFEATGYAIGPPYSTITKNGQPVVNKGFMTIGGMEIFTVAADPKVLPLNSIIYIEGMGLGLVADTGPEIKGMDIDICFRNMSIATEFGRKKVWVIILRGGS